MKKTIIISVAALMALSTAVYAGGHNQASDTGRENGGQSVDKSGEKAVGPNGTPPGLNRGD